MGRSRKKKSYRQDRRVESFPRSLPARRPDKNLRDLSLADERNLRRRQFEPSVKEFPSEFRTARPEKHVVNYEGVPVFLQRTAPAPVENVNNRDVRKSQLPALHTYVSERYDKLPLCDRRRVRRSVLFALHKTGKGSAKGKRHLWTEESKIRCV